MANKVISDEAAAQLSKLFEQATPAAYNSTERRGEPPRFTPGREIVLVNPISEDVPGGACCAVTDTYTSGTGPIFKKIAKPSTTFYRHYVCAPFTGIPKNSQAPQPRESSVWALYNAGTPAADEGFGPTPGQWYWTKNYPEAAVAHGVYSTSPKLMLVTLKPIENGIGKANGTIINRASGAISIWQGTFGSEADISGMDVTAFNLGPDVALNDWVTWQYVNGQIVFMALC